MIIQITTIPVSPNDHKVTVKFVNLNLNLFQIRRITSKCGPGNEFSEKLFGNIRIYGFACLFEAR